MHTGAIGLAHSLADTNPPDNYFEWNGRCEVRTSVDGGDFDIPFLDAVEMTPWADEPVFNSTDDADDAERVTRVIRGDAIERIALIHLV